jgi:hypothetical protein
VLAGEREPNPRLARPETFQLIAKDRGIEPPRRKMDSLEASQWYYYAAMISILQEQARMIRLGKPVTTESSEHDRLLADLLDRTADLLGGLLQGEIPKIFKRDAKPPRSPRYNDAAVDAVAAARLLVEQGCFATVQDAEDWAAEQFGLPRDTLRKAAKGSGEAADGPGFPWPDPLEQRIGRLRDRLHRLVPKEEWQTFLKGEVERAAFRFKEEKISRFLPRK